MDKQWLVVSLALLTGGTIVIQGLIAYFLLKRKIGGLKGFGVGKSLFIYLGTMVPAIAAGYLTLWLLGGVGQDSFALGKVFGAVVVSLIVSVATLGSYLLLLWLFKVPQLREVSAALSSRLKRH